MVTVLPMPARFWARVDVRSPDECWEWQWRRDHAGYGVFRETKAHRVAYELRNGPIPTGLELDHLCRNRACCNPRHLEAVTHRENVLRGVSPSALHAQKTACIYGHPYVDANTGYVDAKTGRWRSHRFCRTCRRAADRRRYWAEKLEQRTAPEPPR